MATETAVHTDDQMMQAANDIWPFSRATGILDSGCGPALLTKVLLRTHGKELPQDTKIVCADFADAMVGAAQANKDEGGKDWERVSVIKQNAMDLNEVADKSKSHVLAGFVYFMTPDPQKCLSETLRVLEDGGAGVVSSWQDNEWMQLMMLVRRFRPNQELPSVPPTWTTTDGVEGELRKAGFKDVRAVEVKAEMAFEKIEDLVCLLVDKMPHMKQSKSRGRARRSAVLSRFVTYTVADASQCWPISAKVKFRSSGS